MLSFKGIEKAVVIDVETTGLNADIDRVVSIAAVRVDFSTLHESDRMEAVSFVSVYDPGIPIPSAASRVHGIHNSDVEGKPLFKDEAEQLRDFIGSFPLIGHNVAFDKRFLSAEFKRAGVKTLHRNSPHCTMRRFQEDDNGGRQKGSRLDDVVAKLGIEGRSGYIHDAEEDALLAAKVAAVYYRRDNNVKEPVSTVKPESPIAFDPAVRREVTKQAGSQRIIRGLAWTAAIVICFALLAW